MKLGVILVSRVLFYQDFADVSSVLNKIPRTGGYSWPILIPV